MNENSYVPWFQPDRKKPETKDQQDQQDQQEQPEPKDAKAEDIIEAVSGCEAEPMETLPDSDKTQAKPGEAEPATAVAESVRPLSAATVSSLVDNAADHPAACVEHTTDNDAAGVSEEAALPVGQAMLLDGLNHLAEQVAGLHAKLGEELRLAERQEKIADRLHAELQEHKRDQYANYLKPLVMEIIEIREGLVQQTRSSETALLGFEDHATESDSEIPEIQQQMLQQLKRNTGTLWSYIDELGDILQRYDVEIYQAEPGEAYTPLLQRVVKKIAAEDEVQHGQVHKSYGYGYKYCDKVVYPQRVDVYVAASRV